MSDATPGVRPKPIRDLLQLALVALVLLHAASVAILFMPIPAQALVDARIILVGKVLDPAPAGVELAVQLPHAIGLTRLDQIFRAKPLNPRREVTLALNGSSFAAQMPLRYCTLMWSGFPAPPPPARFEIRFSDSPGQTYVVWSNGTDADYRVTDTAGEEVPRQLAAWRIDVGRLERASARAHAWRLELGLRQSNTAPATPESARHALRAHLR